MNVSNGRFPVDESLALDADRMLRLLCEELDQRLALLSEGDPETMDLLRRRLLSKLSATTRAAAAKRRTVLVEKFVAQRGRCACGEPLGACVRIGRILPNNKPLRCEACDQAAAVTPRRPTPGISKHLPLTRSKFVQAS